MNQVLLFLLLIDDFVDTEEQALFNQYVLVQRDIVLEEMTNYLNQALSHLKLHLIHIAEVLLTYSQIAHLFS